MLSRIPPASPASTMFTKSSSKTLLCSFLPSASARVVPASTSRMTCAMVVRKFSFSVCLERMSRHCTRGSPALIIVANWRVKMARSRVVTPPPSLGMENFISAFFSRTEEMMIRRLRSAASASSWLSSVSSPVWISPAVVRPFHT